MATKQQTTKGTGTKTSTKFEYRGDFPEQEPTPRQLIMLAGLVREKDARIRFPKNRLEASQAIDKLKRS